jgi:hypothetical protein
MHCRGEPPRQIPLLPLQLHSWQWASGRFSYSLFRGVRITSPCLRSLAISLTKALRRRWLWSASSTTLTLKGCKVTLSVSCSGFSFLFHMRIEKTFKGVFKHWFGELHLHYKDCQEAYLEASPSLVPPSTKGVFAAMTLNIGPCTITLPHRDSSNFASGVCVVIALGSFDHKLGGHLVLHEPGVLFELASGEGVIFGSSCITHENIPIAKGERRRSITFYSAGCLFSYQDMGYKNMTDLRRTSPREAADWLKLGTARWQSGWAWFSKFSSLFP